MTTLAPLWGLILAGGRSSRMGQDKGSLILHGGSQRSHIAQLLAGTCERVFVSCREDQRSTLEPGLTPLIDQEADLGPMGGIVSAVGDHPDVAWLVVACDLPDLSPALLGVLTAGRATDRPAVALRDPTSQQLEPLLAIWEPAMAPILRLALAQGDRSPRFVLESAGCHVIASPVAVVNLNTPDDLQHWQTASGLL